MGSSKLVLGALAFSLIALPVHAQNPVAYWTFNGSTYDSSGNGNNLTGVGNGNNVPTFEQNGPFGQGAAVFNGSDWFVDQSGFPTVPTGNSDYTILAWIELGTTIPGAYGVIGWGGYGIDGPSDTNAFRTDTQGGMDNYWWGNDNDLATPPGDNLYDGQWHLVATTWDSETDTRTVYVDPQLSIGYSYSDSPGSDFAESRNFTVGQTCSTCGTQENFNGEISDLAVFNSALTQQEIVQFASPEPGSLLLLVPALGLGAWWRRRRQIREDSEQ